MKEKLVVFTNERDARRFFLQRRTPCLILLLLLLVAIVSVLLSFCSAPRVPLAPITRAPSLTPTIVPATDLPTRTLASWTPTNTATYSPTFTLTPTATSTPVMPTETLSPSITPTATDMPSLTPTETRVTIPAGRPKVIPTTGATLDDFRLWFVFGALLTIAGALLYWNGIVRYMITRAYARKPWRK